jgi:hypothetical protein
MSVFDRAVKRNVVPDPKAVAVPMLLEYDVVITGVPEPARARGTSGGTP